MPTWLYIEIIVIWTAISVFIGSLNRYVAIVAALLWLIYTFLGGFFPPGSMMDVLVVTGPVVGPFVGLGIGSVVRKRNRLLDERAEAFAKEQEAPERQFRSLRYRTRYSVLYAQDVDRATAFYCDILGFTEPKPEDVDPGGRIVIHRDLFIRLLPATLEQFSVTPVSLEDGDVLLSVWIDNLEPLEHRLHGLGYCSDPQEPHQRVLLMTNSFGDPTLRLVDSESNLLEFIQYPRKKRS